MAHIEDFQNTTSLSASRAIAGQLRVLVVDDSKLQRRIVSLNLKKWGFTVIEAASGVEALNICKSQDIDLVISDWIMPEMDGLEFCCEFRKLERDRYGYFILLTSKNETNDVAQGLDIGADDFLSKPVNSAELKARIRAGTRVLDMEQKMIDQNETVASALQELQTVYGELKKDLVEASKLQHSLIPTRHHRLPKGEVSLLFQSSSHVGGDLVGFFSFSEDHLGIYSIDVSGHGISSALLTARLAGYLSPHNKEQNLAFERFENGEFFLREPADMAEHLNLMMVEEMETELYFTLAYADVNLRDGSVSMVQAGHPHPVLFNAKDGVKFIGDGGPPIGLMPDLEFETFEFQMKAGDRLFLYSDGVTECQNTKGELLDEDGLDRFLQANATSDGPELISDLVWELTSFAEQRPFDDDVSGILFDFHPEGKKP
ncbi:SpoIIE family protein phosphatase [Amylibacter sp. IMCC11727]|uniref:PP2C family protein-serine/threonine phosphatase n=1 Tax=Amylibacter sp. IMCC11727 TaxID=3039851 RepID=UPI00244DCAE6|nr:SpoIIE family protein phosphatase [Amylibacter sp. IMCC11727]WGI21945.1 SpoIIE family protein phosphatase [Amylibacter sp. IMCC11727]